MTTPAVILESANNKTDASNPTIIKDGVLYRPKKGALFSTTVTKWEEDPIKAYLISQVNFVHFVTKPYGVIMALETPLDKDCGCISELILFHPEDLVEVSNEQKKEEEEKNKKSPTLEYAIANLVNFINDRKTSPISIMNAFMAASGCKCENCTARREAAKKC